jgi:hypothetical protein
VIGAVKESGADLAIPASSVLVTNPISLITSSVTSLGEGYIGISASFDILSYSYSIFLEQVDHRKESNV